MSIQPRLISQFYWQLTARQPHWLIPAMAERIGWRRGLGIWPFACRGLRGITRKKAVCVPGYPLL